MNKFSPLKDKLENAGWLVASIDPPSDAWWAFDIWELRSVWRPVGKILYVAFVIDPGDDGGRRLTERDVWSITIGPHFPTGWNCENGEIEFSCRRKFESQIQQIVDTAGELRNR